jgi:hypothetical protein
MLLKIKNKYTDHYIRNLCVYSDENFLSSLNNFNYLNNLSTENVSAEDFYEYLDECIEFLDYNRNMIFLKINELSFKNKSNVYDNITIFYKVLYKERIFWIDSHFLDEIE